MNFYGVDVGYGFVKAVSDRGRPIVFPSVVAPAAGDDGLARALGAVDRYRVTVRRAGGASENYCIGDAALRAGGARSWNDDASARQGYVELVLTALYLLGATGRVQVAVGLPIEMYARGRDQLSALLSGITAEIAIWPDGPRTITIAGVRVYPQGAAAYVAAVEDGWVPPINRPVGVLDIGYRTSEFMLLAPQGRRHVPDVGRSGSIDIGAGHVYDRVIDAARHETGAMVPESQVVNALGTGGELVFQGRSLDLTPYLTNAAAAIAQIMEAHLRREWAGHCDYLGGMLLLGGGAILLGDHVTIAEVTVPSSPELANARGYRACALMQHASGTA